MLIEGQEQAMGGRGLGGMRERGRKSGREGERSGESKWERWSEALQKQKDGISWREDERSVREGEILELWGEGAWGWCELQGLRHNDAMSDREAGVGPSLDCQDEQSAFWTRQRCRAEEKREWHGSLWFHLGFGRPMRKLWRLGLQCCRTKNSQHTLQESNLSVNFSETQVILDAPDGRTTCWRSVLAFSCLQILKHARHLLNPLPGTHLSLGILMAFPSTIKVPAQISSLQRGFS